MAKCWLTQQGKTVAWVSLDEGDNEPAHFFAYFPTALHRSGSHHKHSVPEGRKAFYDVALGDGDRENRVFVSAGCRLARFRLYY